MMLVRLQTDLLLLVLLLVCSAWNVTSALLLSPPSRNPPGSSSRLRFSVMVNLLPGQQQSRVVETSTSIRTARSPSDTDTDTTPDTSAMILLESLQSQAAPIAASFREGTFRPWITNCHVQTIGGFFVRRICPYVPSANNESGGGGDSGGGGGGDVAAFRMVARALIRSSRSKSSKSKGGGLDSEADSFWDHRERIETPDGDWFHADTKYVNGEHNTVNTAAAAAAAAAAPTVILLHGLESNSNSTLSTEMAQAFLARGMNTVCLNFRGCSGTPNDQPGGYHLGFTDDLKQYLQILRERRRRRQNNSDNATSTSNSNSNGRLYLTGFSLGANVVLKCLGELGTSAVTDYNIYGAAVSCAPLDQQQNSIKLALPGINRFIYTDQLLQGLKARAVIQLERFHDGNADTDAFDYPAAMAAETITEFDDAFIAPVYGFDSASDYYAKTSSIHFLDALAVPTMILNAEDDPFLDAAVWPVHKSREHGGKAPLKMVRTAHGGHLGFCWHRVDETDADAEMLLQHIKDSDDNMSQRQRQPPPPSWASAEQARFLAHVESHPDTAQLGQ
jgi:predicted alpha/beta-fold hydrolase